MFNYYRHNINKSIEFLITTLNIKNKNKKNIKYEKNNIYIFINKNIRYNFNNLYTVDLSNINKQIFRKNNIFYTTFLKKNFQTLNIYIFYKSHIISINNQVPVFEWYERELYEKNNIYIKNLYDIRNLLTNYNTKILQNNYIIKNKYNWPYTNTITKTIYTNNNFRITL